MPKMLDFTGKNGEYFLLQHCPNSSNNCLYL